MGEKIWTLKSLEKNMVNVLLIIAAKTCNYADKPRFSLQIFLCPSREKTGVINNDNEGTGPACWLILHTLVNVISDSCAFPSMSQNVKKEVQL